MQTHRMWDTYSSWSSKHPTKADGDSSPNKLKSPVRLLPLRFIEETRPLVQYTPCQSQKGASVSQPVFSYQKSPFKDLYISCSPSLSFISLESLVKNVSDIGARGNIIVRGLKNLMHVNTVSDKLKNSSSLPDVEHQPSNFSLL